MKKPIMVVIYLILLVSCKTQRQSRVELEKSEVMDSVVHTRESKLSEKINEQLFKTIDIKKEEFSILQIENSSLK